MQWVLLFSTAALTAFSNLMLKGVRAGAPGIPRGSPGSLLAMLVDPRFLVGALCLALAMIPYTIALRKIDLSVAYPVMTTTVTLLVAVISVLALKEPFTLAKAAGMASVIGGVVLLTSR